MNTLFGEELPESLSPKLAWLRKHGLITHYFEVDDHLDRLTTCPETGNDIYPWWCAPERNMASGEHTYELGVGFTEDEAIIDYCRKTETLHYSLE